MRTTLNSKGLNQIKLWQGSGEQKLPWFSWRSTQLCSLPSGGQGGSSWQHEGNVHSKSKNSLPEFHLQINSRGHTKPPAT